MLRKVDILFVNLSFMLINYLLHIIALYVILYCRGGMTIMKVKLIYEDAVVPKKLSEHSAGFGLYAYLDEPLTIHPHETVRICTGVSIEVPEGCFGVIYAMWGASRSSVRSANCTGIICADDKSEITVPIHNDSNDYRVVMPDDEIAQLIIQKYEDVTLEIES